LVTATQKRTAITTQNISNSIAMQHGFGRCEGWLLVFVGQSEDELLASCRDWCANGCKLT
jgi:hypothetical protein